MNPGFEAVMSIRGRGMPEGTVLLLTTEES
jgi:hypothetical protein